MKTITFYFAFIVCLLTNQLSAQETFESKAIAIANKIENIKNEEKAKLKLEVEVVNNDLEKGLISKEEADKQKLKLAEKYSKIIEDRLAEVQLELNELVQQKVDGKIKEGKCSSTNIYTFLGKTVYTENDTIKKAPTSNKKVLNKDEEKRTTTQFVLAFGANNLVTNKAVANSDFYYWQSHFFEWGFTRNTRILKDANLLHFKYGFSVMYNNLCPTENRYYVPASNNQTNLEVFPAELEDSRFKNVYIVAPLHLEFDLSDNKSNLGTTNFSTHKGFRFGIGGYTGLRIKSKQKLYYNVGDDKIRIKTKGNFNANDFIYGLSTYVGYKATSLYIKYDLNPLFENNDIDQRNISLGIRFDFN